MGCGGSRLTGQAAMRANEGGVVPLPAGIRPLIRRRLEEMKKRSHVNVLKGNQTLSKKELLKHGSSEDGEEAEENEDKITKSSAKVAPVSDLHVEEKKEVIYEKIVPKNDDDVQEDEKIVKKQDHDEEIHHDENVNDVVESIIVVKKEEDVDGVNDHDEVIANKKEENDCVNHDEEKMNNLDERMICNGSPSFRVYCVDVVSDDEEEKDGESTRESMETESVIIEHKEDGSIVKQDKKERRGKRFGIALPRRYLANVTATCYAGGGCMGNNTQSRLMQEKSNQ
ncbi:unnamed protein product [Cochlearia groenlandica]